jgi:ABC-type lipoprotein export system ATPase subunit
LSEPILKLRGVTRDYPSGERLLQVLKGVDLDVQAGEIVGLIGPSGSGKSSLLSGRPPGRSSSTAATVPS